MAEEIKGSAAHTKKASRQYCDYCGEFLGEFEHSRRWDGPFSCGASECEREIRYMLQAEESERQERTEEDGYSRY